MVKTCAYHGLEYTVAKFCNDRICYILLPEGMKEDGKKWMEEASQRYACTIVTISGMDWNDALTPWPAKGVFKKEKDFGGRAQDFLKELPGEYFLSIETTIGVKNAERTLVGISLSGLFAIWASTKTDIFTGIASISGSLWYDNFAEWFKEVQINPAVKKFFLSLGDKEKKSKDARMATVEDATNAVAEAIRAKGFSVEYIIDEGTHFSPIVPRLDLALKSLYKSFSL